MLLSKWKILRRVRKLNLRTSFGDTIFFSFGEFAKSNVFFKKHLEN